MSSPAAVSHRELHEGFARLLENSTDEQSGLLRGALDKAAD